MLSALLFETTPAAKTPAVVAALSIVAENHPQLPAARGFASPGNPFAAWRLFAPLAFLAAEPGVSQAVQVSFAKG